MWEYGLPNYPQVPVETGLNRRINYILPNRIPHQYVRLLNASESRAHWECMGLPDLLYRNTLSYPYYLQQSRMKWIGNFKNNDKKLGVQIRAKNQVEIYQRRYTDHYIPQDLLQKLIVEEESYHENGLALRSERQGNAFTVMQWNASDVVFFPTGELLHKVQCKQRRREKWKSTIENPVDLVNTIQQIECLGDSVHSPPRIITRGAVNCNIISFTDDLAMDSIENIRFPSMLQHIAASPYAQAEISCISTNGELYSWTPEDGPLIIGHAAPQQRWIRCEYSSHPCVLWVANSHAIGTYDYRTPPGTNGFNTKWIFDHQSSGSRIIDMKRHSSSPFQLVVRSDTALDVIDVRSPHKSMIKWNHENIYPNTVAKLPPVGSIDMIDVSTPEEERGLLISGSAITNKVSVHWYTGSTREASASQTIKKRYQLSHATMAAAGDAVFDIHLPDDSKHIHQIGARVLYGSTTSCDILQLTSLGDLYCQRIEWTSDGDVQVQSNLRSGRTTRDISIDNPNESTTMPIPAQAYTVEYDAASLAPFRLLPVPRLVKALTPVNLPVSDTATELLVEKFSTLSPSCTLYALMRTWVDVRPSYTALVDAIQMDANFIIRTIIPHSRHDRTMLRRRERNESIPDISCKCDPFYPTTPCEDPDCPLPHLWIVSEVDQVVHYRPSYIKTNHSVPYTKLESQSMHSMIVQDLEAEYGRVSDLPMSPRRARRHRQ